MTSFFGGVGKRSFYFRDCIFLVGVLGEGKNGGFCGSFLVVCRLFAASFMVQLQFGGLINVLFNLRLL